MKLLNKVFIPSVALFSTLSGRTALSNEDVLYREQFLLEELSEMFKARQIHDVIDAQIDFMWFAIEALYLYENKLPEIELDINDSTISSITENFNTIDINSRSQFVSMNFLTAYCMESYANHQALNTRLQTIIFNAWHVFQATCESYGIDPELALNEVVEANMSKFYFSKEEADKDVAERYEECEVKELDGIFAIVRKVDNKTLKAKHFKAPNWEWVYD